MKHFFVAGCLAFFFPLFLVSGEESTLERPLSATITYPTKDTPIYGAMGEDPLFCPEETFEVHGVAEPNSSVSIYGWTIIPGSDGRTDAETSITNFTAAVSGGVIQFSWQPREMFQKERIFGNRYWSTFVDEDGDGVHDEINGAFSFGETGGLYEMLEVSCQLLKTWEGGVPSDTPCFLPKSPAVYASKNGLEQKPMLVFDQIVHPDKGESVDLTGDWPTEINSTMFQDRCEPQVSLSVGWEYEAGPFLRTSADGLVDLGSRGSEQQSSSLANQCETNVCLESSFFDHYFSECKQVVDVEKKTFEIWRSGEDGGCENAYGEVDWGDGEVTCRYLTPTSGKHVMHVLEGFYSVDLGLSDVFQSDRNYCAIEETYLNTGQDNCLTAFCSCDSLGGYGMSKELLGCYEACDEQYVETRSCSDLDACVLNCHESPSIRKTSREGYLGTADNQLLRVKRMVFPAEGVVGQSQRHMIVVDRVGEQSLGPVTFDLFDFGDFQKKQDVIPTTYIDSSASLLPVGEEPQPESLDCWHDYEGIFCQGELIYQDSRAVIVFDLPPTEVPQEDEKPRVAKRELYMRVPSSAEAEDPQHDDYLENLYTVHSEEHGSLLARLDFGRDLSVFELGEEIETWVSIQNLTAEDLSQIYVDFGFDPACLDLASQDLGSLDSRLTCENPGEGSLSCRFSYIETNDTVDFSMLFTSVGQECYNTPLEITLSQDSTDLRSVTEEASFTEHLSLYERIRAPRPLLEDTNFCTPVEYSYFNPQCPEGHLFDKLTFEQNPQCAQYAPGYFSETVIEPGEYYPNTSTPYHSGVYFFWYSNYHSCQVADAWAEGYLPIRDQVVLVDGFEQYELYGVPAEEYEAQIGVTRENAELLAVMTDPSASSISLPAGTYEGWHFALFEVRESQSPFLPSEFMEPVTSKQVQGYAAKPGHLITSANELMLESGEVGSIPSPQKKQWEIYNASGIQGAKYILANTNGDFRESGQTRPLAFAKKVFHRFAQYHFLSGSYQASDTPLSSSESSFSVLTGAEILNTTTLAALEEYATVLTQGVQFHGNIFDAWKRESLNNAKVYLFGQRTIAEGVGEPITLQQETGGDGHYSFSLTEGEYRLDVVSVAERANTFIVQPDCQSKDFVPYQNVLCRQDLKEPLSLGQYDIALLPLAHGIIQGQDPDVSYRVLLERNGELFLTDWTTPEGRFSFFAPPGDGYRIMGVEDASGNAVSYEASRGLFSTSLNAPTLINITLL